MPWTDKQISLFAAVAHNPEIAKRKGIPMRKARTMLMESTHKQRSKAMKARRAK